jgi:hypothetical protein
MLRTIQNTPSSMGINQAMRVDIRTRGSFTPAVESSHHVAVTAISGMITSTTTGFHPHGRGKVTSK